MDCGEGIREDKYEGVRFSAFCKKVPSVKVKPLLESSSGSRGGARGRPPPPRAGKKKKKEEEEEEEEEKEKKIGSGIRQVRPPQHDV